MKDKLLTELSLGEKAEIIKITGGFGLQNRLKALGLTLGQHIESKSKIGLGGPIIITVNRSQIAIGRGMASKILVRSIS